MIEDRFWQAWHALFPARFERFLRFRWMIAFVALVGIFDLVLKLVIKLPPEALSLMQRRESLIRAPWFLICYNVILLLGLWTKYRTRYKLRFYPVRVVAFGVLLAGLLGQMLILLVPWHT